MRIKKTLNKNNENKDNRCKMKTLNKNNEN